MFKTSLIILLLPLALNSATGTTDCTKLLVGQFLCPDPDSSYKYIDEKTQSVSFFTKSKSIHLLIDILGLIYELFFIKLIRLLVVLKKE
jgi:hypothetical protein